MKFSPYQIELKLHYHLCPYGCLILGLLAPSLDGDRRRDVGREDDLGGRDLGGFEVGGLDFGDLDFGDLEDGGRFASGRFAGGLAPARPPPARGVRVGALLAGPFGRGFGETLSPRLGGEVGR